MTTVPLQLPAVGIYTKQNICDNTLDDADLETRCPLDNGRHTKAQVTPLCSAGRLDQLPAEVLVPILLLLDLPSLTGFRRVNYRSMQLVDSVPQYAALIKHCPNIVRAILSIRATAFDCGTLYNTLCTTRCATCARLGDHLYLIDCQRVCYFCYTRRLEYFPLTIDEALKIVSNKATPQQGINSRQSLSLANPPNVLSLAGQYCNVGPKRGIMASKRLQLFDRRTLGLDYTIAKPELDRTTREPRRFMSIITAPYFLDSGQRVEWGYFCRGCRHTTVITRDLHCRNKYTREEITEHFARFGQVVKKPVSNGFMHPPRIR